MNTKDRIYSAAMEMFGRYGYQGVKIDALVKKAKVNKTTFYYYFESKHEIFEMIMRDRLTDFKNKLTDRLSVCVNDEETADAMIDIMFSRDLQEVQLFSREILEGGENLSDELFSMMFEIVDIQAAALAKGSLTDHSFLLYMLIGVSDFYLSLGTFKQTWDKKNTGRHTSLVVNFDETHLRNKLKTVIMNELTRRG